MIEYAGWIGSICLAVCGIPQAIECYRTGKADGLSHGFLWLWFSGTVLTFAYIVESGSLPLLANYSTNLIVIITMIRYKYFPRSICQN